MLGGYSNVFSRLIASRERLFNMINPLPFWIEALEVSDYNKLTYAAPYHKTDD